MKLNPEVLPYAWRYILMLMVVLTMFWRLADETHQQGELSKRQLLTKLPGTNRPSNRQV